MLLRALRVGGGSERLSMTGLFQGAPESEGRVALAPWLVGIALITLVAEVVMRRLLVTFGRGRRAGVASSGPVGGSARGAFRVVAGPVGARGASERARRRLRR